MTNIERTDSNTVQKAYYDARLIMDLCRCAGQDKEPARTQKPIATQMKLVIDLVRAAGLLNELRISEVAAGEREKEAVRMILEQRGLLENRDGKWRISDGADNVFRDIIYLARFRKREAEITSLAFRAALAIAGHADNDSQSGSSAGQIISQGIADGAINADGICNYLSVIMQTPADTESTYPESLKQWAGNILNVAGRQMTDIPEKDSDRNWRIIHDMQNVPAWTDTVKNLLAFDKRSYTKLLKAFSDIYQEVCPGDRLPTKREAAPWIESATEQYSFERGASTITLLSSIQAQELFVDAKITLSERLRNAKKGKGFKGTIKKVNDSVSDAVGAILTFSDACFKKTLRDGVMQIKVDDITEEKLLQPFAAHSRRETAQHRGYFFFMCMQKLRMFEWGDSTKIKTWFQAMRMTQEDAAWAIANLKAGMEASANGVRINCKKQKEGIQHVINEYRMLKERPDYERLIEDFEAEHRGLVTQSFQKQAEARGDTHKKQEITDDSRNVPADERLRWINLSKEEYVKAKLEKILKQYDIVIMREGHYRYCMSLDEIKSVVIEVSDTGYVSPCDMVLIKGSLEDRRQSDTLAACEENAREHALHDHLTGYDLPSKLNGFHPNKTLRPAALLLAHNGFNPDFDDQNNILFTRGDLSCALMHDDPDPLETIRKVIPQAVKMT